MFGVGVIYVIWFWFSCCAIFRTYKQYLFYFIFWRTINCVCEWLQVMLFGFWFSCRAIIFTYEQLQAIFLFLFLECNRSHVQTICKSCDFISGVQPLVCVNDCKSCISKPTTFLSELVQTCASLCKPKKVGKLQAQPARSKFWQVHSAANFFYHPPFPIQDICIIQSASMCLVSMAWESKASFVYFCLPSLPMTMATKIQPLRSVKSL